MAEKLRIIKKIAKHGRQNVIVVPTMLKDKLKAGSIVQISLEVIQEAKDE